MFLTQEQRKTVLNTDFWKLDLAACAFSLVSLMTMNHSNIGQLDHSRVTPLTDHKSDTKAQLGLLVSIGLMFSTNLTHESSWAECIWLPITPMRNAWRQNLSAPFNGSSFWLCASMYYSESCLCTQKRCHMTCSSLLDLFMYSCSQSTHPVCIFKVQKCKIKRKLTLV